MDLAPPPDPPAFWPEEVGVGTFGTVVRGNRDGIEVVGKAIHRMERQRTEIQAGVMTEVYALERCAGIATITQLWDLVMVGERFVLIFEPWGKHLGDFLAFPGNRRADFLRKILGDVVAGVGYLHSPLRLLHADLKSNNVLVRAASAPGELPAARVADLGSVLQAALPPSPLKENRPDHRPRPARGAWCGKGARTSRTRFCVELLTSTPST